MRVMVFGSDGFVGRNVCNELESKHDVIKAVRRISVDNKNQVVVDLLNKESIKDAFSKMQPDAVINCAGVVSGPEVNLNVTFTENILEQTINFSKITKFIISGSASEYGILTPDMIPVNENTPLNANNGYGLSKVNEERVALDYAKKHKIGVVVLRIFNPIGDGMGEKFLVPRLLNQINEFKLGIRKNIEVSRLDSKRDYVSIKDVAKAYAAMIDNNPTKNIYNVGSGVAISNGELLDIILKNSKLKGRPNIVETMNAPEPIVANCADITRISNEFNWLPEIDIEESVRSIINGKKL